MMMAVGSLALNVWHIAALGLGLLLSVLATGHVVLHKRDSRAAIAWVGFVWLVPLAGAVLYFIFGVNRIRRKAALLRANLERYRAQAAHPECPPEELQRHLPTHGEHLKMLSGALSIARDSLRIMTPLGWGWALFVWGYALAWFLVNDRMRLLVYRIFDPAQPSLLAKKPLGVTPRTAAVLSSLRQP